MDTKIGPGDPAGKVVIADALLLAEEPPVPVHMDEWWHCDMEQLDRELGYFGSYARAKALMYALILRRDPYDRLRLWHAWGNMVDAPWAYRSMYREVLVNSVQAVPLELFLREHGRADDECAAALAMYNALPAMVPIWRGCERGRERGLSWTISEDVARGFASGKRWSNERPTLVRAIIPKQHVLFVLCSREEDEINPDYRRLRQVKRVILDGS
jgi:hypothetical protein